MEKRRSAVRRHALAALIAAVPCAGSLACELPAGERVESPAFVVSYRAVPQPVRIGEHFALEYAVCARGTAVVPALVTADAWMPAHRHGMNYTPAVQALGIGRFRAEGFLLHMPGDWEFVFRAGSERISHRVRVE